MATWLSYCPFGWKYLPCVKDKKYEICEENCAVILCQKKCINTFLAARAKMQCCKEGKRTSSSTAQETALTMHFLVHGDVQFKGVIESNIWYIECKTPLN